MTQKISSKETCIKTLPRLFNNKTGIISDHLYVFGNTNVDLGGGKYELVTNQLLAFGVTNLVIDPYNRSAEHNALMYNSLSKKPADTATISNVLNVIQEKEARLELLRTAKKLVKQDGKIFISVYEGDRSGVGKETRKGYQCNKRPLFFLSEVLEVFPSAIVLNKIILAVNY